MEKKNLFTSSFRAFLLRFLLPLSLIFCAFGWAIDTIFVQSIILESEISGGYKVCRIFNETYPEEIPIFGSSRALCSFLPSMLGDNYFNYGISAAQDIVWITLFREELHKDKNTPVIINFDPGGISAELGDILNFVPCLNGEIQQMLGKQYHPYMKVPFIRFFGNYDYYTKAFLQSRDPLTKYVDKGASSEKNVVTPKRFQVDVNRQLATQKKNFVNDPALTEEFKSLVRDTDRLILFVVTPLHPSYFVNNTIENERALFLNQLDNEFSNLVVLDYSRLLKEDSLFFNTTHVNYKGAQQFSKKVRSDLDSLGNLYH